ncbi:hypothetical protein [Ekhidna sp.]
MIPIPSNKKRFIIRLKITALHPLALGIVVYDPSQSFSDYFRRKVTFRASAFKGNRKAQRDISIPIPVSPDHLTLEVYNKNTGREEGFKVEQFKVEPMEAAEVWASPERHQFMDFAIKFAQKAGFTRPGFYHSPDHSFLIQYLPTITDPMGKELVTPARIHREMPRVQLSQKLMKQFTVPVRVAILSHEGCHFFQNTRSEKKADLCGIKYYLDYGFPTIEAVYAATKVFMLHPESVGEPHVQRTKDIMDLIDQHKAEIKLKKIA